MSNKTTEERELKHVAEVQHASKVGPDVAPNLYEDHPGVPLAAISGNRVIMAATVDEHGGLLAVEYGEKPLPTELAAAIMANLIKDTLGDEPDLRDVMTMQRALVATLQGGESAGQRTV
jgi:hypothetical protein